MKSNLLARFIAIILVALTAAWLAWRIPPRLGIDLAGGTSLLYELDVSKLGEHDNVSDVAARVIAVLRNRVDPKGQKNIIWRVVGGKRIQIQMPNPPKATQDALAARDAAKAALEAVIWKMPTVDAAAKLPAAQREEAFSHLAPKGTPEYAKLEALGKASDDLAAAVAAQDKYSNPVDVPAAVLDQNRVAADKRNQALADAMSSTVGIDEINNLLDAKEDNKDAQEKLAALPTNYPLQKAAIENYIKAERAYREISGGGVDDPNELQRLVTRAGVLDFRIAVVSTELSGGVHGEEFQEDVQSLRTHGPEQQVSVGGVKARWFAIDPNGVENFNREEYVVTDYDNEPFVLCYDDSGLNNTAPHTLTHADPARKPWSVKAGTPGPDPNSGGIMLPFELDSVGGAYMGELTSANTHHPMAILLDDKAMTAPNINSTITDSGEITFGKAGGSRTQESILKEANQLKQIMDAGSLPATLQPEPISVQKISSSMGADNIAAGKRSAYYAVIAVVAFMFLYYTITGFFADVALMLNLLLVLATMAMFSGTFTLPGIAGLVLTLGMAVDANVLINERIREEIHKGASLWMAIKQGYDKVFWTIFDANLTCSLTAIVLYEVGSEDVKGFGLTLLIGLAIHMFTALFVTRTFMMAAVKWGLLRAIDDHSIGEYLKEIFTFTWLRNGHFPFMRVITVTKIDWIAKRHIFWAISAVFMLAGIAAFMLRGDDKYDIEFRGGTQITFHLRNPLKDIASRVDSLEADADTAKAHPELKTLAAELKDETDRSKLIAGLKQPLAALASDAALVKTHPEAGELPALLEEAQRKVLTIEEVRARIQSLGDPNNPAYRPELADLRDALVYTVGEPQELGFEMQTTIRNKPQNFGETLPGPLEKEFGITKDAISIQQDSEATTVTLNLGKLPGAPANATAPGAGLKPDDVAARVKGLASQAGLSDLAQANVVQIADTSRPDQYDIRIPNSNIQKTLVAPLAAAFKDVLDVTPELEIKNKKMDARDAEAAGTIVPIAAGAQSLDQVFAHSGIKDIPAEDVRGYARGAAILLDEINPPEPAQKLHSRIDITRRSGEFQNVPHRDFAVLPITVLDASGKPVPAGTGLAPGQEETRPATRAAVVTLDPAHLYDAESDSAVALWRSKVATTEWNIVQESLAQGQVFDGVTSFDAVVANQAKLQALLAVLISLVLIVIYVWVRFGGIRYGLGAIFSLVHDAIVAVAFTVLSGVVYKSVFHQHPFLLITDYKINLTMIAAYLTIIGYSVNDTIVIFDRVRELRGKAHVPLTKKLVNDAINQCFGRTIWTTFTVFIVVLIMYIWGGEGVRGFSFAMLIGVITGAYSTLAIASPMLLSTGTGTSSTTPRDENPFQRKELPQTTPPD